MSSESKEEEVSQHAATTSTANNINDLLLQDFLGKVMSDLGGAYSAVLVYVGDKLGLYKAMAEAQGEAKIAEVVKAGGFKHFRRDTQTQVSLVYEAKA
jgi:hypothetical protein